MQSIQILNENFGEQNVELNDTICTIRLEPFYISTETGDNHLIQGMWIRFKLKEEENLVYLQSLEGTRTKQTNIEHTNKYYHSHLPRKKVTYSFRWEEFCKGNGEFGMQYFAVNTGVEIEEFRFFIMMLKNFLSYEDNSNPFIRLSTILPLKSPDDTNYTTVHIKEKIRLSSNDLGGLQFDNDYYLLDNEFNHDLLLAANGGFGYGRCYKIDGRYVQPNQVQEEPNPEIEDIVLFKFKEEEIKPEILPSPEAKELPKDLKHYVNPYLFNQISNYLHNEISTRLLQAQYSTASNARTAYCNFIRQMSKSDQILMFSNL